MSRYYKVFQNIIVIVAIGLLVISCGDKSTHPITWHFWIDNAGTKILKFTPDGKFFDLYDYANTYNNKYEIGEKILNLKYFTQEEHDSADATILYLEGGKLVIKYKDNRIDSLKQANDKALMVGNWGPFNAAGEQDYFTIGKETYDCTWKNSNGDVKYFRYKIISDTKVVFDYYLENRQDTIEYSISKDGLALMFQNKSFSATLKRM